MLRLSGQGRRLLQPALDAAEMAYKRRQTSARLLMLGLALRNFHEKHGDFPDRLSELVPDDLPISLQDPFSGKSFVYRKQDKQVLLYSVGPDGQDDGGKPLVEPAADGSMSGDLVLTVNAD